MLWEPQNGVKLNINISDPYEVTPSFNITSTNPSPTPTFSTYINTTNNKENLPKAFTLKPQFPSIYTGNTFSLNVTSNLANVGDNPTICAKIDKGTQLNCEEHFKCVYNKDVKIKYRNLN
mmetsp:Transcript_39371/g.38917  ORF Transcript_39371/g.38917 Transcript_39371/m.38917 type:complete len:120 (+) Transcript_39371:308-667(+)